MSTALLQTESGTAPTAAGQRAKNWIISPVWDLVFLIAAPLAIVPLVSLSAARWLDIEEISLVVLSLATLGHHLPGFLRAYGDRDLFSRFRGRFIWAPPLTFAAALFSAAYGLHGLALMLLFWATWHGLMQTYGFMRIYDMKQGSGDRQGARLDFLLCVVIFTAGVVFSDARVFGIAKTIAKTGLPLPGPLWLSTVRWVVGGAAVLVIAGYVVHLFGRIRRGTPLAWPRVALGLSTGWLYWLGGALSTDLLLGVATFEIFHALQYDAIVWAYNRGRARKPDALVRPLGAMFQQDRWASMGLYVALIVAFSSIRLVGEAGADSWTHRVLLALLTTSTFMHFYFDGFIWKVSERKMQDGLTIADRSAPSPPAPAWRLSHATLCASGVLLAAGLIVCELMRPTDAADQERESLARLAELTPQLPELQWEISDAALARGDTTAAVDALASTIALRPHSQMAHDRLGAALLAAGRYPEAAEALREATRLGPRHWKNHCNLGIALDHLGQRDEATAAFERADHIQPGSATVQAAWARMCERLHDDRAAIEHFQAALAIDPADADTRASLVLFLSQSGRHDTAIQIARDGLDLENRSASLHLSLGKALSAAGRYDKAIVSLGRARDLATHSDSAPATPAPGGQSEQPVAAAACYELAVAQLQLGQLAEAEANLDRVLKVEPNSYLAHFQFGNVRQARGDVAGALQGYRRSIDLEPKFAPAYSNLATVLSIGGDAQHARKAYEQALTLAPDDGNTHYNLGLLLFGERQIAAARNHFIRARDLGMAIPPDLSAQLQLSQPQAAPQRFGERPLSGQPLNETRPEEHRLDGHRSDQPSE